MVQHRYGRDPETGRVGFYEVDKGPAQVPELRGISLSAKTALHGTQNTGRKGGVGQ